MILAQLSLYKPAPGHGSRDQDPGTIPSWFYAGFRGFRAGDRIMSGDASRDHIMSWSAD